MALNQSEIDKRNNLFDEANQDRKWCWGCKHNDKPLSRAHIVRYSSIPYKGSKLILQMDITNMAYLCMDNIKGKGCHNIWDNNSWTILKEFEEIQKLECFVEFMQIIREKDPFLYERRIEIIQNWIRYYDSGILPFQYKLE